MSDIITTVAKAAISNKAVEFNYRGTRRVISPTDFINGKNGKVLVGKDPANNWKRFVFEDIENIQVSNFPHNAKEEVGWSLYPAPSLR